VTFEVAAVRRTHADGRSYDWHIGAGLHDGRYPRLILSYSERHSWPRLVREFGITRLSAVSFQAHEERLLFGLDCDL
jgi:hypothetical protein